jgi:hypothetical protein
VIGEQGSEMDAQTSGNVILGTSIIGIWSATGVGG